MARIHFPGRPGQRVGRTRINFQADETTHMIDQSMKTAINISSGLKLFREVFGESEEEEFEGFSTQDLRRAKDVCATKVKEQKCLRGNLKSVPILSKSPRRNSIASHSVDPEKSTSRTPTEKSVRVTKLSTSETGKVRPGRRYVVRQSYAELNKHGFFKRTNASCSRKRILQRHNHAFRPAVKHVAIAKRGRPPGSVRVKSLNESVDTRPSRSQFSGPTSHTCVVEENEKKADYSNNKRPSSWRVATRSRSKELEGEQERLKSSEPKLKHSKDKFNNEQENKEVGGCAPVLRSNSQTSIARKLLDKAKKKNIQRQDSTETRIPENSTLSSQPTQQGIRCVSLRRKAFALPARSARSSRIIIPKKRSMEDFDFSLAYSDAKRMREESNPLTDEKRDLPLHDKKIGSLEQPLIVEGKRPWKPTVKVQMKLSEGSFLTQRSLWKKMDDRNSESTGSVRERIKKDISQYAETMARQAAAGSCRKQGKAAGRNKVGIANNGSAAAAAKTSLLDVSKASSPEDTNMKDNADEDKGNEINDKVVAKIERILRSQWEGRLRRSNPDGAVVTVSSKVAESGSQMVAQQRASTQWQTKNILRKARLQLNKRTLMKLRQPSSLRKLSEQFEKDQEQIQSPIKLHSFPVIQLEPVDPKATTVVVPKMISPTLTTTTTTAKSLARDPDTWRKTPIVVLDGHLKIASNGARKETITSTAAETTTTLDTLTKTFVSSSQFSSPLLNSSLKSAPQLSPPLSSSLPKLLTPTSVAAASSLSPKPLLSPAVSSNPVPPMDSTDSKILETKVSEDTPIPKIAPVSNSSIYTPLPTPYIPPISGERKGPRIKHVCRRAAVVLGYPKAKFPMMLSSLRGAGKLRRGNKKGRVPRGSTLHGIRQKQSIILEDHHDSYPFVPNQKEQSTDQHKNKFRKVRCRECEGCLAKDCGECIYCLDRIKYGGKGVLKKACKFRVCVNLQLPRNFYSRETVIKEGRYSKRRKRSTARASEQMNSVGDDHSVCDYNEAAANAGKDCGSPCFSASQNATLPTSTSGVGPPHVVADNSGKDCVIGKCLSSLAKLNGGKKVKAQITRRVFVPRPLKQREKEKVPSASSKIIGQRTESLGPTGISSRTRLTQVLQNFKSNNSKDSSLIKADYWEEYDPDEIWTCGMPLLASSPLVLRYACYLCGSAGTEELIFCVLCCEPFHTFCLDLEDVPHIENRENWCCRRCQFCNVCGQQEGLLKCNKCQITYHAACLGPNYPSKPSKRKKIWVCTRCVRCKSCGATSPGSHSGAQWMYDFSFCTDCGKLMEKGNFCPVCKKCYEDDDYESKMVQCSKCVSWVHAKCDNMTDEMYQVLSYLPDSVVYTCSYCSDESPPSWLVAIKAEIKVGLEMVLSALLNNKSARYLSKGKERVVGKASQSQKSSDIKQFPKPHCSKPEKDAGSPHQFRSEKRNSSLSNNVNASSIPPNGFISPTNSKGKSDIAVKLVHSTPSERGEDLNTSFGSDSSSSSCIQKAENILSTPYESPPTPKVPSTFNSPAKDSASAISLCNGILELSEPADLKDVKRKLELGKYTNVMEFYEDVVRILEDKCGKAKRRHMRAVKAVFLKSLERIFPWLKLNKYNNWNHCSELLLPDASIPPYSDHCYAQYLSKNICESPDQPSLFKIPPHKTNVNWQDSIVDSRVCVLCLKAGDDEPECCGRLLYCGQNDWIHLNCALWSAEVFEEVDGSLQHVHSAISRGSKMKCETCQRFGATVGCCVRGCPANYHFMCARRDNAVFQEDKKVFCCQHSNKVEHRMPDSGFIVQHTMYVDLENLFPKWSKKTWLRGLNPSSISVLAGWSFLQCRLCLI